MNVSETTLYRVICGINDFLPVKVTFNDMVLYNDYDSEVEIEEEMYGEMFPPSVVVPERIVNFENSIVTSVNIKIVQYHHSIVEIYGEYKEV